MLHNAPGSLFINSLSAANTFQTILNVSGHKNINTARKVTQNIIGTTAYEYTRVLSRSLTDGITLQAEKILFAQRIRFKIRCTAEKRPDIAQYRTEETFMLVITFEYLLAEAAFLGSQS
ncbi:hypothetical protein IMSAGC014_00555 [Bacteroidaceae bacterium]|nr:hypothetical protein IMSAGC014_00555 [Bacteroidaceae bacterium]